MAPSANRRSGYSRRAQYTNFFAYLAAAIGALVGVALLIVSLSNPESFGSLRSAAADVAVLPSAPATNARAASVGAVDGISGWFDAARKNARLTRELAEARTRLAENQGVAHENRRLKALLALGGEASAPVAFARMTSSTASSTRRFATIAAGSSQGVRTGMPVRTPLGLVGRVLETGRSSARVLLLTDTQSVVPARRSSDGVPAFVEGRGDGSVQVRLINLGINPLKAGDIMVTSGSGGLFRPNTAICVVTRITRDGAICRVLSDPAASEYVAVEPTWSQPPPPPAANQPDNAAE